jgi:esterase/lipase
MRASWRGIFILLSLKISVALALIEDQLKEEHKTGTHAVVMIHGMFDSPASLQELGASLGEDGTHVSFVTLPGHENTFARLHEVKLEEWRSTIDEAIESALRQSPSGVSLVGFSAGGLLALDAADRFAGDIRSITLLGPAFELSEKMQRLDAYRFSRLGKRLYPELRSLPNENQLELIAANAHKQFASLLQEKNFMRDYHVPVHLVLTEDDAVVDNRAAERFLSLQAEPENYRKLTIIPASEKVIHEDIPRAAGKRTNTKIAFFDQLRAFQRHFMEKVRDCNLELSQFRRRARILTP